MECSSHAPTDIHPPFESSDAALTLPEDPSSLFKSNATLKQLVRSLKAVRLRIVEAPSSERHDQCVQAIGSRGLDPIDSFRNATAVATAIDGWSKVSGFCILQSGNDRFFALRHDWLCSPSNQWLDPTPLVCPASTAPRLLVEAKDVVARNVAACEAGFTNLLLQKLGHPVATSASAAAQPPCATEPEPPPASKDGPDAALRAMIGRCASLAELSDAQLESARVRGELPVELAALRHAPMRELRTALRAIGLKAHDDAFAGVNAEVNEHVRVGPRQPPISKGASAAEGTAIEAFKWCASKMGELEKQHAAALRMASQALERVVPNAKVAHLGTVDGRLLVALDDAVPGELVAAARENLAERAAFRRHEQSSPNADQRHFVTDHDAALFCATPLYERIVRLAQLFFHPKAGLTPQRIYTNSMMFGDVAHIHRDGGPSSVTALLYPNEKWHPSLSGETMFFTEEEETAHAVLPKPGRLLLFVGSIKHCGRPPSRLLWGQRFTLAIKFQADDKAAAVPEL